MQFGKGPLMNPLMMPPGQKGMMMQQQQPSVPAVAEPIDLVDEAASVAVKGKDMNTNKGVGKGDKGNNKGKDPYGTKGKDFYGKGIQMKEGPSYMMKGGMKKGPIE